MSGMRSDLRTPPGGFGAWQEVKGEAMLVNEALYVGAIEGTVYAYGQTEADDGLKRI